MATDKRFNSNLDWMKLQQQYIDAVSSFYSSPQQKATSPLNLNSWNEAMEFWWQSAAGQLPDKNKNVFEALLNQSRVYYSISEQFTSLMGDLANKPDDWQTILTSHLDDMKSLFDLYQNQMGVTSVPPAMMWTSPIDSWNQAMASILPDETINKMLSIPAIGMTGDIQEKSQKTIRLWNEYQQCSQRYNMAFVKLGKEAIDKLGEDIIARARSGKKITSLKEIYNLWIDANEEIFEAYAKTEEYSLLYAGLVNSLVNFKKHYNELSEDILKAFNMPTNEGVDAITKQQHEMKKELRESRDLQLKVLKGLEKIEDDLQKLKKNNNAEKNKPPGKKATVKKKTQSRPVKKTPARKKSPGKKSGKKT